MTARSIADGIQIYTFDELPKETVGATYRRAVIRGDNSMVGLNWFEPGHPPWPLHSHPFDQISFVLSGRMRLTVGGVDYILDAPSVAWIPADIPHCGNVFGDDPCLNLDVFGIVREDFLHLTAYQGRWVSAID